VACLQKAAGAARAELEEHGSLFARGDQRSGAPVGPSTQFCQVGGKGKRKALLLFSAAHGPLLKLGCGMAPLMEHVFAEGQRDPGANPRSRMSSEPGCFWG
jgi:hypothetical protein